MPTCHNPVDPSATAYAIAQEGRDTNNMVRRNERGLQQAKPAEPTNSVASVSTRRRKTRKKTERRGQTKKRRTRRKRTTRRRVERKSAAVAAVADGSDWPVPMRDC